MNVVFFINTPAQVHLYKNIIKIMINKGHQIKIMARDYGETLIILREYGLKYFVYSKPTSNNVFNILMIPLEILRAFTYLKKFSPNIIIGGGISDIYTAFLLHIPCIGFSDGEPSTSIYYAIQLKASLPLIDVIITPQCYLGDLGKKQLRINSYKELAYLHPKYFQPDKSIFKYLGITEQEKYIILRFSAFNSLNDSVSTGFSNEDKINLVKYLEQYATVFISAEGVIPSSITKNSMKIPKSQIHHALFFADLVVTDTGTITTESACLGIPTVVMLPNIRRYGNFVELEDKYNLIFCCTNSLSVFNKISPLVNTNSKNLWRKKRDILLNDKINITTYLVWFIENYPNSYNAVKENSDIQYNFN